MGETNDQRMAGPTVGAPGASGAVPTAEAVSAPTGSVQADDAQVADAPSAHHDAGVQGGLPERHFVHHSYIWLGSLRAFGTVLVALIVGCLGSLAGTVAEMGSADPGERFGILVGIGAAAAGILVLGVVIVVVQVWSYRHLFYEVGEEEFSLYSGIFTKKCMHIPYQRVQSVNHTASILQRLAGVCTVKIETAGGASNEGATVPYITNADAETLRLELFARKQAVLEGRPIPVGMSAAAAIAQQATAPCAAGEAPVRVSGQPFARGALEADGARNVLDGADELLQDVRGIWGGLAVDTGHVTYEHGLSNRELVLTGLTNSTGFALVAIGVIGTVAQIASGIFELFGDRTEEVANAAVSVGRGMPLEMVVSGIVLFLLLVAFLWALSAVGSCVRFGGFRARRRDTRIEVEHGLLSRKFHGVDVDRVQSVIIRQGFIRRLMGYCEVSLAKVDSAAQSSEDAEASSLRTGLVVHPFVKMDRVPKILAGLVPEFADAPVESRPVAPVALRRALVRRCTWAGSGFWIVLLAAAGQVSVHAALSLPGVQAEIGPFMGIIDPVFVLFYVVGVLVIALEAVGAVLWFRESSFAFNRRFMQVTNGGFSRESVLLPRKKIQFGTVKTNPFQRAAGVATLSVTTAAGLGTTLKLVDVRKEDAEAWLGWLRPGGNRTVSE